jgi:hypothetical protein
MHAVKVEMTGYVLTEDDVVGISDEARVNGTLRDIEAEIAKGLPFPTGTSVQVGMRANHGRGPSAVPTVAIGGVRLAVGDAVAHHEALGFVKIPVELVPEMKAKPKVAKRSAKRAG